MTKLRFWWFAKELNLLAKVESKLDLGRLGKTREDLGRLDLGRLGRHGKTRGDLGRPNWEKTKVGKTKLREDQSRGRQN